MNHPHDSTNVQPGRGATKVQRVRCFIADPKYMAERICEMADGQRIVSIDSLKRETDPPVSHFVTMVTEPW